MVLRKGMAVVLVFFLMGCAAGTVAPDAVELGVDFSWEGVKRCSKISPKIRVAGVPAGTVTLKVKLKDLDVPRWNHGGGSIAYDGSGIIPAGALKSAYNGPCPPSGSHRYQFSVKALDNEGVVIGMGKAMRTFP